VYCSAAYFISFFWRLLHTSQPILDSSHAFACCQPNVFFEQCVIRVLLCLFLARKIFANAETSVENCCADSTNYVAALCKCLFPVICCLLSAVPSLSASLAVHSAVLSSLLQCHPNSSFLSAPSSPWLHFPVV
jgi:hypothetical protein